MSTLVWNAPGKKRFQAGVDRPAVFVATADGYGPGVAWEGVTAINESPSGGEPTEYYANNTIYAVTTGAEKFEATINAYDSPDEFDVCDGMAEHNGVQITQQARRSFGLAYCTGLGNDLLDMSYGTVLHLLYGLKASPSAKDYTTTNESTEPGEMSWSVIGSPVNVPGYKPSCHLKIRSTDVTTEQWDALIEKVYGGASTEATLIMPAELLAMFPDPTP